MVRLFTLVPPIRTLKDLNRLIVEVIVALYRLGDAILKRVHVVALLLLLTRWYSRRLVLLRMLAIRMSVFLLVSCLVAPVLTLSVVFAIRVISLASSRTSNLPCRVLMRRPMSIWAGCVRLDSYWTMGRFRVLYVMTLLLRLRVPLTFVLDTRRTVAPEWPLSW